MPTVLITCSGLGSRLLPITGYLNKSLIKIGDKAILSLILESYPLDSRFIITLGYLKDQIVDYIAINHSNLNIEYVDVDCYDGPNSSLLYSMSKALDIINEPFYYNACDTLIKDIGLYSSNTSIISKTFIDNQYRRISKNNIEDFPAEVGELCYTGVSYIHDYNKFKDIAKSLLENPNTSLSDAHVLQKMDMKFQITDQWIDIGNFIALDHAKAQFKNNICVLEKSDSETYFVNRKIIKYFKDFEKVQKLYERNLELHDCTPHCKILGNFLYYDFIDGNVFSEILNEDNLIDFLNWCNNNLWISYNQSEDNFFDEFYVKKAKNRVKLYIEKNKKRNFREINFRKVLDIEFLLDNIPEALKKSTELCRAHGDLVFENVIKTSDGFTLIDWRDGFITSSGDKLYDIAKMKHNLIFDHSIIKEKKFYVKYENDQCFYDSGMPECNQHLIDVLDSWCVLNQIDVKAINLIVALIQLSSAGLHTGDDSHLLFHMGHYNLQKIYVSS